MVSKGRMKAERMHERMFFMFRLTDSSGRVANFKHSLIVMTTNLGGSAGKKSLAFDLHSGGEEEQERVQAAVTEELKVCLSCYSLCSSGGGGLLSGLQVSGRGSETCCKLQIRSQSHTAGITPIRCLSMGVQ